MQAFTRGRRAFSIAAILMLLTALAHTLGSLSEPATAEERDLVARMEAHRIPVGLGMEPSFWDIQRDLTFTMSICLAGLAVINFMLSAGAPVPAALLRRIAWVNLVWMASLTALAVVYHIAPMLISGVLILVVILVSLL